MDNGPENLIPHQESRRIEVVSAENFWDDFYRGDDYDRQFVEKAERYYREQVGQETEKEEPLTYIPFEPEIELGKIRKLLPEELALTVEERIKIKAERLERFKENLIHQKKGIARVINDLRFEIESRPYATPEDLMLKVKTLAPEYRFTREQIALFEFAILKYREKHLAVEKYRAEYPDDLDLYEACFGKRPKGKIEIIKGPMTLFFRCFDRHDYVFISSFYKHQGDVAKIQHEDVTRADLSGGVALNEVKIKDLSGVIIAENVENSGLRCERIRGAEKTEEIHEKEFELLINHQKGDIDIEVRGVGKWQVKVIERDEQGEPVRIQFLDLKEIGLPPIFDVVRVRATEEMRARGNFSGVLKRVSDGELHYNMIGYFKIGNKIYGLIDIDSLFLKIKDWSALGTVIKYREDEFEMTPDDKSSERVRIHEEQHQFNKLFQPFESREGQLDLMQRVVEGSKTPEEAKQNLIRGLVRWERKFMGFDSRARDEIIACYKEGKNTGDIFEILTTSELYDYVAQYKDNIGKVPSNVREKLMKEVSEVLYDQYEWYDEPVSAQPLEIREGDVLSSVAEVFGNEYKADLKDWLASIGVLEQKGYTRDEIVALLYQEPVNYWPNLARRMGHKKGLQI